MGLSARSAKLYSRTGIAQTIKSFACFIAESEAARYTALEARKRQMDALVLIAIGILLIAFKLRADKRAYLKNRHNAIVPGVKYK